ncbi:amino acid adenylation domain-containing protein [Streptomyces sp. NPDC056921]|uniref:amino acid adenylation domain-containing protein n=1 Tax=Streptomyces sp. NPDC056921 TaxID=3345966 RepID=UPI00362868AA
MTSDEPTNRAQDEPASLDQTMLITATAAVLGHFDGDADQELTVWHNGAAGTFRVSTTPAAVSGTLLDTARTALSRTEPTPIERATRVVDLSGDCPELPEADLLVRLGTGGEGPRLTVSTGAAWSRAATPVRLAEMITRVAGFLADPGNADAPLSRLPFLTADERRLLVVELNDTAGEVSDRTVAQWLADLADEDPQAPAVITRDRVISRAELRQLARQLADDLTSTGLRQGDSVYVCLPRSAELVVAWMAALGMGVVCVPVDPAYPPHRIAQIVSAERPTVITVPSTADLLPQARQISVSLETEDGRPAEPNPWPAQVAPDSVVYVMHTSGSTGDAKGVAIREIGLRNLMHVSARQFGLATGRRSLSLASPGFDASVWELLAPLYAGAAVVPFDDPMISADGLAACVRATRTDTFFPFSPLLARLDPKDFPGIRTVITAGELFSQELVDRWQPGRDMIYAFGPTEATALQSWHYCRAGADEPAPTIGRPMSNLRMWLLDPWGGNAAPGAVGELYIGGLGVGAGYVGLPRTTAEKFVVLPELDPDGTLYRTGDLASFRPDGNIDFRGRRDNQVKLRGFRVELGEVETVLAGLPGIDTAIAVLHEATGERLLVAHLIPLPGAELPSAAELREHLAAVLPYYMIPSAFVPLVQVPYTPNGKIDRAVLAACPLPEAPAGTVSAPGTGEEMLTEVRAVFATVLRVPEIAPDQDFFVAGGHSLGVAEIAAKLKDRYQVEVRARDLFECPTPRTLTARIAEHVPATTAGTGAGAGDELGLLPVQAWQWLLQQARPKDDAAYNVPALFTCGGDPDPARLRQALAALQLRHPMLRATIRGVKGVPQVALDGPELPLETLDLRSQPDPEAARAEAVRVRSNQPFDLAAGPALRTTLLRMPGHRDELLTVAHHIVCDGPGIDVLARDLVAAYEAATPAGEPQRSAAVAPLTRDPLRVGHTESALLDEGAFDGQLEQWRQRLLPAPAPLPLPVDHARVHPGGRRTSAIQVELGQDLTQRLRDIAKQARTGLVAPLAAAVAVLLNRSTGQDDICVGTPVNLRGQLDLTEHVTNCANTAALRIRLRPGSCTNLIGDVAELMHEAIDQARFPFHRLVAGLEVRSEPFRNALFDVFVTCYRQSEAGTAPGMTLSGRVVPLDSGLCDLSFQGCEHADGLTLILQYDRDLYREDTAQLLLDQWRLGLSELSDTPETPWSQLSLRAPAEESAARPTGFGGFRFGPPTDLSAGQSL